MKYFAMATAVSLLLCLSAGTALAERKYFLAGLEVTLPDTWIDIDSQKGFLKDRQQIERYTHPRDGETLPLIRIIDVAAPDDERGMLTFSIKPCYRGECPSAEQLQWLARNDAAERNRQLGGKLIVNDGSRLLEDYGVSVVAGCGGYFVNRGQKVEAPFGGVFISKSRMFYRDRYVVGVAAGYAEKASDEVIERTEAALDSFSCMPAPR